MSDSDTETVGWDAIEKHLAARFCGCEPQHFAAVPHFAIGGNDPLDGISAYPTVDSGDRLWHFVTFGFSELYAKESEAQTLSGFGFEATFVLPRETDDPPSWALSFLQNIARYVFSSGNTLGVGHHMDLNGPIALEEETSLQALLLAKDPVLGSIDTENGRVLFLRAVGITLDELAALRRWNADSFTSLLAGRIPDLRTDLRRSSVLEDQLVANKVAEGIANEGSSTAEVFLVLLEATEKRRLFRAPHLTIAMAAKGIMDFADILPSRIRRGQSLSLIGRNHVVHFLRSENPSWSLNKEHEVTVTEVRLSPAAAEDLAGSLRPIRGTYPGPRELRISFRVEPTPIKDQNGNVTTTIG